MSYQVIPRQFRPQTFHSVVGQLAIVTTLTNALRMGRLAHAYLFCGCRGTGKTTLARLFAKALNCPNRTEDQEPCNQCPSCKEVQAGRSLDVIEIDGASNRSIDDIRQINETIGYTPAASAFKIYIIDEVHMLTKEAFNALLKTLEEPPENVKFLFATTEPHKIPATIISRCQRFDLNRIAPDLMRDKLRAITTQLNIPCEEEALSLIAHLSEGSLRDAESLLDKVICFSELPVTASQTVSILGLMPKTMFFDLDTAICQQRLEFAFEMSEALFASGREFSYFFDHLLEHFQTYLQIKLKRTPFFLDPAHRAHYIKAAEWYTEDQLLHILDYLLNWQQQLQKSSFKRVGIEMVLLHLLRSKNQISLPSLVQRIKELSCSIEPVTELPPPPPPEKIKTNPSHYDTIIRFAAVELEGH